MAHDALRNSVNPTIFLLARKNIIAQRSESFKFEKYRSTKALIKRNTINMTHCSLFRIMPKRLAQHLQIPP